MALDNAEALDLLLGNAEFVEKISQAGTLEELQALMQKENVMLDAQAIDALRTGNELDEDALSCVVGGAMSPIQALRSLLQWFSGSRFSGSSGSHRF